MSDPDAIQAAKRSMRAEAAARRAAAVAALGPEGRAAAATAVSAAFRRLISLAPGSVVSAYWPFPEELDCRPLLEALYAEGHRCALPVVVAKRTPLAFRQWTPGAPLVPRPFGLMEPPDEAPALRPDALIVPLLAVDGAGYRLGYGAGFYDRTLQGLRAEGPRPVAVGVAYQVQRVEAVPREATDQPLDWLITEAGADCFDQGRR